MPDQKKDMTRAAALVCLLLLPVLTMAQTIRGKVVDGATGETLIGVNVTLAVGRGAVTDLDGRFEIKGDVGVNNLNISFLGYRKAERKVTLVAGETQNIDIKLQVESKELDIVVVTGSQYEKKINEEMVTIDVVKNYLIENNNAPDLKAAVDKVPGVTVLDGQVSIRGGSGYSYGVGSRVQMVVDDMPMLSGDMGDIHWGYMPIEVTEQVEVVKGAASSMYGSSALNGVIHIRTGWAGEKPETDVRTYMGFYNNPRLKGARWWDESESPILAGAFISHRQRFGNLDLVVGSHVSSDQTYLKTGHRQIGRFNFKTRYRDKKVKGLTYGIAGNIQYQQSGRFILWADDTTGAYVPMSGTDNRDKYYFLNIDPQISYVSEKYGSHSVRSRFFQVARHGADGGLTATSNVLYADYRFQHEFKYRFHLIAGTSFSHTWSFSSLYPDITLVTENPALYAQLEKKLGKRLNLLFGIRDEWYIVHGLGTESSDPIFRGGINYQVAKKTNIRASFGQSYRFASVAERYIQASLGSVIRILPNDSLQSERGWSAELGVKQGFRIGNWNAFADLAIFWMEMKDMIEFSPGVFNIDNGSGVLEPTLGFRASNVGHARVAGIELGLTGDGRIGPIPLRIYGGYTFNYPGDLESDTSQRNVGVFLQNMFQSGSFPDTLTSMEDTTQYLNRFLKYRLRNVFKCDMEFDLGRFTIGGAVAYNSYMERIDGYFNLINSGIAHYRKLNERGIWTLDLRLTFRVTKRSSFTVVGKNVTNEFYSLRPGVMEAPRSFTVQYRLNI